MKSLRERISRRDLARSEHARTFSIYAQGNWGMRVIRGLLSEPHLRDGECRDVLEELTPERFRDVLRLYQQQAFIHRDRSIYMQLVAKPPRPGFRDLPRPHAA